MNKFSALLISILALPGLAETAAADQAAMNTALRQWEQLMREYEAACKVATTPNQIEAIRKPNAEEVALLLWYSVNKKTGKKSKLVRPTDAERMQGASDKYKEVPTYEFQQTWAAPAVVWFLNHPQDFAGVFGNKTRQVSYYANALLESVEEVHYASPHIADACAKLAESPSVRIYELLQKIYTRNQTPAAKANAALAMAILLSNPTIASAEKSPQIAKSKQVFFLREAVLQAPEDAMFGNTSVNQMALELTYAIRNLSLDAIPPQIEVIDKDGNKHKYPQPGNPTLIFFWTPEESIGLDIVQRQHLLTQQFPGLQFCPVTLNQPKEDFNALMAEYGIEHSYMDNEQNAGGRAYRVSQIPMAVLVDEHCRILFIGFPNQQLQAALNNHFNAQKEAQPKVLINGEDAATWDDEEPILQPGSRPKQHTPSDTTPQGSDEAPPLREMPEF